MTAEEEIIAHAIREEMGYTIDACIAAFDTDGTLPATIEAEVRNTARAVRAALAAAGFKMLAREQPGTSEAWACVYQALWDAATPPPPATPPER